jgi:membrane protein DedA with SNARE-associated domain
MFPLSIAPYFKAAAGHPLLQAITIIVGTFILEDAATILAAMEVEDGHVGRYTAIVALYAGIILGDLGLYGLGRLVTVWPRAARMLPAAKGLHARDWLERHVFRVVFISRFIPGARLPTYTTCGFIKVNLARFFVAAVLATSIWTTLLFIASLHVGRFLIDHLGAWRWLGAGGFAAVIVIISHLVARARGTTDE